MAGIVHKKYPDLIVLKTNYPKNLLTKFLKKNKISRTKPSIENIKKVYAFFKEQGFIKYDMHNLLKERIIWHIEGLKEGVKV